MKANLKSTDIFQSHKTGVEHETHPLAQEKREKASTLHVQTGVQAGGFFDSFYAWWEGVADGFNLFDRSTGAGG